MMDAGVPIKEPVAGIAMGLIKEGDDVIILSDILGLEDHLGDMDFKVCGTKNGVTALQMDIKIGGITTALMQQALEQARLGRSPHSQPYGEGPRQVTAHRLVAVCPSHLHDEGQSKIRFATLSARAAKPSAAFSPTAASRSVSKIPGL